MTEKKKKKKKGGGGRTMLRLCEFPVRKQQTGACVRDVKSVSEGGDFDFLFTPGQTDEHIHDGATKESAVRGERASRGGDVSLRARAAVDLSTLLHLTPPPATSEHL